MPIGHTRGGTLGVMLFGLLFSSFCISGANMQRLNIAKVQLRSFMSDTIHLRAAQPNEVAACAKVREALALLTEAELLMAPPAVFHRLTFDKWKRLG